MGTPFKMKGSPMARNYGAPLKQEKQFGIGDSTTTSGQPVVNRLTGKQTLTKAQRSAHNQVMAEAGSGARAMYVNKVGPKIPSKVKNYKKKVEAVMVKNKKVKLSVSKKEFMAQKSK